MTDIKTKQCITSLKQKIMKAKPSAIILSGPPVAYWTCPSCGTKVRNLDAQGRPNRIQIDDETLSLPHPVIHEHVKYVLNKLPEQVCLDCYHNTLDLLGSLSMPYAQKGSFLEEDGKANTYIIGVILPSSDFGEALVSLFQAHNDQLVLAEECPISDFDLRRITIPLSQGEIHPELWKLYQRRIDERHENWVHLNAKMVNSIY